MEQQIEFEELVFRVITCMKERRYSENTISRHKRIYSRLAFFLEENGTKYYSDDLASLFLKNVRQTEQNRSPRSITEYTIALNKLTDAVAGQKIQLYHGTCPTYPELTCFSWVLPEMESRLKSRLRNKDDIRSRMKELRNFLAYLEIKGINTLSDLNLNHLAETFRNAKDKYHFHSAVCEFLQYAFSNGWIPSDISCFVPKVRTHKAVPSVYSEEEIKGILNCIDDSTTSGKRKRAVVLIAARLGLRNSDICELKFSNIDWVRKEITLIQKKTGNPISLPLLPEIEEAILAYISVRPQSDLPYIFLQNRAPFLPLRNTTFIYELRSLFKQAGISTQGKRCSPHTLRASLASSLLKEGVSYPTIQKVLGHNDPSSTKYYVKVDIDRLRDCALEVPKPSGKFAELIGGKTDGKTSAE